MKNSKIIYKNIFMKISTLKLIGHFQIVLRTISLSEEVKNYIYHSTATLDPFHSTSSSSNFNFYEVGRAH